VLGMGVFAHFHQAARVGVDQRFQRAGRAGAITASGAQIAMATAPILLRGSAERSRRALVAQGLRPRRAPRVTFGSTFAATLLLATSWVGFGGSYDREGKPTGPQEAWLVPGAFGLSLYAIAVGTGLAQLRYNEAARERALWWGRR
ncbi:MAG: hypothetical protein KC416_06060, partial [Myxococcales bacterium]|nr:hypothetical protein [Myxococcales bacterium]